MASGAAGGRLEVGVVTAPHGIRGGLRVRLPAVDAPLPGPGVLVRLERDGTVLRAARLRACGRVPGKPMARLFLEGLDDRDAAAACAGASVTVDRAALPPLAEDEFYLADAVGKPVRGRVGGKVRDDLGRVVAVVDAGPNVLFEVAGGGGTWFLLAGPPYLVDVAGEAVVVDLPEGMGPEDAAPGRDETGR